MPLYLAEKVITLYSRYFITILQYYYILLLYYHHNTIFYNITGKVNLLKSQIRQIFTSHRSQIRQISLLLFIIILTLLIDSETSGLLFLINLFPDLLHILVTTKESPPLYIVRCRYNSLALLRHALNKYFLKFQITANFKYYGMML